MRIFAQDSTGKFSWQFSKASSQIDSNQFNVTLPINPVVHQQPSDHQIEYENDPLEHLLHS